jgi:hypothetical protein
MDRAEAEFDDDGNTLTIIVPKHTKYSPEDDNFLPAVLATVDEDAIDGGDDHPKGKIILRKPPLITALAY